MRDQADFLDADKQQSFLLIDTIVFWAWAGMHKAPKITSLQYLSNISRKMWGEFDFFDEDKHWGFLL